MMFLSPKFIWAICLATLSITLLLVTYTSTQFINVQLKFSISPLNYQKQKNMDLLEVNSDEKYITFLPHSGLHNQRIGLINAMVIAKSLNRTLILPHINIGKAINWKSSSATEDRLSKCHSIKFRSSTECKSFRKYVPVSTESVFDLSSAHAQGIRTLSRTDMSLSYFEDILNIKPDEILRIPDEIRFSYRIYDSKENDSSLGSFTTRIDLDDLREAKEKVILFGSLHYTLRLAVNDPYLIWLGNHLREEMSFFNPNVIRQALNVLGLLGGPDMFVGAHLRQGDGYFKALMESILNDMKQDLERAALETPYSSHNALPDLTEQDRERLNQLLQLKKENDIPKLLNQCLLWNNRDNHPQLRVIYMATDTPSPRSTLSHLFDEFPCMFTLSDFPEAIESILNMHPMLTGSELVDEEMEKLGAAINPLMFPLIDAEIASHGYAFIGTRKSTFSQYIKHRYQRFQKTYHPKL